MNTRHARSAVVAFVLALGACTSGPEAAGGQPADSSPPTVRVLSDCHEEICEGQLLAGAYRSAFFEPAIDFEITSPGWTWFYSGSFGMLADRSHEDLYSADGVYFLRDPAIASQDCEETEEPGVGTSVDDLVAWLDASPGLSASEPVPVTVGGLEGMRLDIELDPEWKRTCFYSDGLPVVPLIFNGAKIGGYSWAMLPDQSMRWYVLDSGDGVMIVDIEDGPGGVSRDELIRTGSGIVESLVFSSP